MVIHKSTTENKDIYVRKTFSRRLIIHQSQLNIDLKYLTDQIPFLFNTNLSHTPNYLKINK